MRLTISSLLFLILLPIFAFAQKEDHAQKAFDLLQMGKLDEAIGEFQAAIKADPKDIRAHVGLAQAYQAKPDLDGAIREYRAAIDLNPREPQFRMGVGNVLLQTDKPKEALAEFRIAEDLAPRSAPPLLGEGAAYSALKLDSAALDAYTRALGFEPDSPSIHAAL